MWHVAVLHVVETSSTNGLPALRELGTSHSLTIRLFYRQAGEASWEDTIIIIEGEQPHVDSFIEGLHRHEQPEAPETPPCMRGVSMLLRQWTYLLPMEDGQEAAAAEPPERHLGPVGLKGGPYEDMKELAKRLERLKLGCSWQEVLMAAELSSLMANRQPAAEVAPRKKRKEASPRVDGVVQAVGGTMQQLDLGRKARTST